MKTITIISTIVIGLCLIQEVVIGQENAQFKVPESLEKCYRDPNLINRENRLPMTINTLIDLIRKIERSPDFRYDIRQFSTNLIHRFRVDGIVKAHGVPTSPSVLPYSPADFQFSKHRVLLTRLLSGNTYDFPNKTLTPIEQCTLHFMLSSSFEMEKRPDENQQCKQLAQFRSIRIPRSVSSGLSSSSGGLDIKPDHKNYIGDMEYMQKYRNKHQQTGKMRIKQTNEQPIEDNDEDYNELDGHPSLFDPFSMVDIASDAISQCPIENGVIRTTWGAISAGTLISGIAAGLQPQKVDLRALLNLSSRRTANGRHGQQQTGRNVDNKWAATIAGDLAEVALIQIPVYADRTSIGASGAWNSTTRPKWYFLSAREKLEMTDAEIRGGMDGLIIANKIVEWKGLAPNMKLSDLLTSYYSHQGVLNSGIRACDRKKYFTQFAPIDEIKEQTYAFATVLDREMRLQVTINQEAIKKFSEEAAEKLSTYIPSTLNDLSCEATQESPNDPIETDIASDLVIYLDTTWPYEQIVEMITFIVHKINVNPFGTHITLKNAATGQDIVGTTDSISDFDQNWTLERHQEQITGLKLSEILKDIQNYTQHLMQEEKQNSSLGGRSLITLIVPYLANVADGESNFAYERISRLREEVPDLKILFYAGGSVGRFSRFVQNEDRDLFTARLDNNIPTQANPVIKRISEIPRRIINYRCGSNWNTDNWGPSSEYRYITPNTVQYHRLVANYYFAESNDRKMKIQGQINIPLTVCSSRISENPRANMSSKPNDLNCHSLTTNSIEFDLSNLCEDYYEIHNCPSFYVSIEANRQLEGNSPAMCTDPNCQFPNQIRVQLQTDKFSCFSGVGQNLVNISIIIIMSLMTQLQFY